jgi:hypothetical protein
MSMEVGERYGWTYVLLQETLNTVSWLWKNIGLLYDSGCKFKGFVNREDPELAERMTIKVNAFHAHGHPVHCQVLNGPRRACQYGLTKAEGVESDWAAKRHLVAQGRTSGSETQKQVHD